MTPLDSAEDCALTPSALDHVPVARHETPVILGVPVPVTSEACRRPGWRARCLDDDPISGGARAWSEIGSSVGHHSLDSEEAMQEAWLMLLAGEPLTGMGRDREDLPAAVTAAISNHLAALGRRAKRRACRSLEPAEAALLVGGEEDPAEAYERSRVRAAVREVLEEARERLSKPTHRIVALRGIDGLGYQEIAAELGMPLARVRDRHRRAMSILRELFSRRFAVDSGSYGPTSGEADPRGSRRREVTP